MTRPSGHLASLFDALTEIEVLLDGGRVAYDAELTVRLSLQRLWIIAGEAARRYCQVEGLDDGVEPWSDIRRLRDYLAHHLLEEIDGGRLWVETTTWIDEHLQALRSRG